MELEEFLGGKPTPGSTKKKRMIFDHVFYVTPSIWSMNMFHLVGSKMTRISFPGKGRNGGADARSGGVFSHG